MPEPIYNQWISVVEAMPPLDVAVIITDGEQNYECAILMCSKCGYGWIGAAPGGKSIVDPSHWYRPIPFPIEGDDT